MKIEDWGLEILGIGDWGIGDLKIGLVIKD
jgi:hypothetical protein